MFIKKNYVQKHTLNITWNNKSYILYIIIRDEANEAFNIGNCIVDSCSSYRFSAVCDPKPRLTVLSMSVMTKKTGIHYRRTYFGSLRANAWPGQKANTQGHPETELLLGN